MLIEDPEVLKLNGIKVNYYFICERKLWLFSNGISLEKESDRVFLGKILEETSFKRDKAKRVLFDDTINIDVVYGGYIREVKLSNRALKSSLYQLKYYLYYLERFGIKKKGILSFPKQRRRLEVELTDEDRREIEDILVRIKEIENSPVPPPVKSNRKFCKKCAYYSFCFA